MPRIQIETGVRNAQMDTYKGREIVIATGYDARSDKWPVHIYIDGERVPGQWLCDRIDEAFDAGFRVAEAEIDQQQ